MIYQILFYFPTILILICYLVYVIVMFISKNKTLSNEECFSVVSDILSKDSINIIKTRNKVTYYDLKRKVLKISSTDYEATNIWSVTNGIKEVGISNYKSKFKDYTSKVLKSFLIFEFFGLISVLLNNITYTINDTKLGIIAIFIILILHYLYITMYQNIYLWAEENIDKKLKEKVLKSLLFRISIHKIINFGEFIILFRFMTILITKSI